MGYFCLVVELAGEGFATYWATLHVNNFFEFKKVLDIVKSNSKYLIINKIQLQNIMLRTKIKQGEVISGKLPDGILC